MPEIRALRKDIFGATPNPASETELPGNNQTERFCITSYLQLRELDLLGPNRFGGHRPPLQRAASSSSHSPFCEEVFSRCSFCSGVRRGERRAADTAAPTTRMRWIGQIFWLLAYD